MAIPLIPELEPEVVQANARAHYRGDTDKVATTTIGAVRHRDVDLSSRYSKAHELRTMAALVEGLTPELLRPIESIFCDSKATSTFTVTLKWWKKAEVEELGAALDGALMNLNHGHNGIYLKCGDECEVVGPNWVGDDTYDDPGDSTEGVDGPF